MTQKERSKRGLLNLGVVLLVIVGINFLRSDFVFARYAATRVRVGETEDEVRRTLGEPRGGMSDGTTTVRRSVMFYGDLRIGLVNDRVVSIHIAPTGS